MERNNYLKLELCKELTNKSEIIEQITLRNNLRASMVGKLYPSILTDEIRILYRILEDLRKK